MSLEIGMERTALYRKLKSLNINGLKVDINLYVEDNDN